MGTDNGAVFCCETLKSGCDLADCGSENGSDSGERLDRSGQGVVAASRPFL